MVKMFPEELSNRARKDPKKRAEIKLYDAFREHLKGNWYIYYNVAWLGRTTSEGVPRDGETDFIVVHPDHGVLLIEVKGGAISYQGTRRQWVSTDKNGEDHDIDPFNQVIQCKYALRNKLKSLPRWSKQRLPLYHAVAFPDSLVSGVLPPEAPEGIILDGQHIQDLQKRLLQIFQYWQGEDEPASPLDRQFVTELETLLAPTIKLRNPLRLQVEDEEQEILRLTDNQCRLIGHLNRIRRAKICGCAGSGKTMMAVEKAKRLADEGFRTLLTCYNSPLADHLTEVTGKRENLTVCTFHALCLKIARDAGILLPQYTDANRNWWYDQKLPEALMDGFDRRPDLRFDAIIVDEGQDFADNWWVPLECSLTEGRQSVFYVFYDDNQKIYYNRGNIPEDLHLNLFPLSENVRNTRTIHHTLVSYYKGEEESQARGPVGRSIEIHHCVNDLYKQLSHTLNKLVRMEGIACKDIVVLTPRSLAATSPHHSQLPEFKLDQHLRLVQKIENPAHDILYSTIHRFKGLERPIVIVVEIDEFFDEGDEAQRDALCYVAFSRPRSHLILMGKQPVITKVLPQAR